VFIKAGREATQWAVAAEMLIRSGRSMSGRSKHGHRGALLAAPVSDPMARASVDPRLHEPTRPPTLGQVMRAFKSISAIRVNRLVGRSERPLWQRSFYERIILNDDELQRIHAYINDHPINWPMDRENPAVRTVAHRG
jgi:hypothetical protein